MSDTGDEQKLVDQLKALKPAVPPPPTLVHEIRRLIAVHGAEAVKAEIKAATKARAGRKMKKDWLPLRPYSEADARDWLEGRDPFVLRKTRQLPAK